MNAMNCCLRYGCVLGTFLLAGGPIAWSGEPAFEPARVMKAMPIHERPPAVPAGELAESMQAKELVLGVTLGGVSLGEPVAAGATVTPVDLAADSTAQVNIARFLQTFDADGDPSNGISITAEILEVIEDNVVIADFGDDIDSVLTTGYNALPTDVQTAIDTGRTSAGLTPGGAMPADEAQAHLDETLATNPTIVANTAVADALIVPSRITLSDESEASSLASVSFAAVAPVGSDYDTTPKRSWVEDGVDALEIVNEILTMMDESDYTNHVNKGPYKALVTAPDDDEKEGGDTQQQGSTTVEELQEIILNITRADNQSPMIVKMWMVEEMQSGPNSTVTNLIKGYFSVTESVSSEKPYGAMSAYFRGNKLDAAGVEVVKTDGTLEDPIFTFAMSINSDSAGNTVVQAVDSFDEEFIDDMSGELQQVKGNTALRMVTSGDLDSGKVYLSEQESDWDEQEMAMVYPAEPTITYFSHDVDNVKVQEEGSSTPTVYSKDVLTTVVHQYQLFDSSYNRVRRSSGFPVQVKDQNDEIVNGYVGYYGIWFPHGAAVGHGSKAVAMGSDKEYYVYRKNGKLRKHTRDFISMTDIAGLELSYWMQDPSSNEGVELVVQWNATTQVFDVIGARDWENGGGIDETVASNYTAPTFTNGWEGVWCNLCRQSERCREFS